MQKSEPESSLYVWCFTYRCFSSCVYKCITILDGISFVLGFLNMIQMYANTKSWVYLIGMVIAVVFLYCAFKAWMLFCSYSSNFTDGTMSSKTQEYLAVRRWFVIAEFVLAIVIPGLILLGGFVIADQQSTSSSDKNQIRAIAVSAAISTCLGYLIAGWLQLGLQKSLAEATAALTGSGPLVQNQVV